MSQFCTLKRNRNRLREYSKIRNFITYKITFLMTCQQHNWWIINSCPRSYPNFKIERSYENVDFRTWKIERRQTRLVSHFDYRISSYSFFNGLMYCDLWISQLMLLACHKKSYLICDEIMIFWIFTKPIPNFFSKYKTETAKTGQRHFLENE